MQQGRVQTPDFKNNLALKPAARPVDTFEAPAQVPQDNNTARLVDALSAFSNTIGQLAPTLGQAEAASKNKKDDAALAERQNFFMKASPEEQRRYIVEKHGLDRDEVKQAAAIGKMDGARYAEMVQGELQTHMQTEFDWNNGDPEDYARRFLQDKLQEIGRADEPTFVSAYSQAGQSFIQNVSAMRIKRQADQMDVKVKGAASDYFRLTVDDSVKAGDDPRVTANKLLTAASDAGMRSLQPIRRLSKVATASLVSETLCNSIRIQEKKQSTASKARRTKQSATGSSRTMQQQSGLVKRLLRQS